MSFGFGFSFPQLFGSSGAATPVSTDASFPYVSLLAPGDGTNGTQNNTFLDSSTNNFTITRNGTPTQGTFTPFSQTGWGGFFDGSTGYLSSASNAAFAVGTVFTVELWVWPTTTTNMVTLGALGIGWNSPSEWGVANTGVAWVVTSSTMPTQSAWNHVAIVRTGTGTNQTAVYLNGVSVAVGTFTPALTTSVVAYIGSGNLGASTLGGYISNLRIVKGVAVYTGAFTPPTAPLAITQSSGTNISAITGTQTSLLTLQSNYFKDQTAAALIITPSGTTSIQAFSPFEPTAAYAAATNGGTGYFNGTTDSLYTPANAVFAFGTGDFTVECWMFVTYPLGTTGQGRGVLISNRSVASSATSLVLQHYNSRILFGTPNTDLITGTITLIANTWIQIAVSRASGTLRLFVNGALDTTVTSNTTNFSDTNAFAIGTDGLYTGYYFTGYISNTRLVKGTAVYTAAFTPPTAPLTAITNTSLLLSGTNAGIIDNSAKNTAVTTVGNAQVSTAQSQWGGGSMLFDGTGDWVTVLDTPVLRFGTGDFTVEGWVYKTTTGTAVSLVSKGAAATGWTLGVSATNFLTASYTATTLTGTVTTLSASTWYYFALVRSGTATGNIKLYINGTLEASSAGAITTDFNQTDVLYIGASRTATTPLTGYIDDLRITKAARTVTTTPTAAFPLY